MKISIIGAGNVGATLAKRVIEAGLGNVVLVDVVKGLAEGKMLDLMHAAQLTGSRLGSIGTDDYSLTKGSDIIVITAGFPRQPGMSRADLIAKNTNIIKEVVGNVTPGSPNAILIIVTNPLDVMVHIAHKVSGFKKERVMGMAGVLDSSRFAYIIANELNTDPKYVETIVLGQHGPHMVPLISHTKVLDKPLDKLLSKEKINRLIKEVRESGAKIVGLLGKGSAYYAPSAAIFTMIKEIVTNNKKKVLSASCLAQGEYSISNVFTGLPVKLGKNGIEEIVKLELSKDELAGLKESVNVTKELISKL